MKKSITSYAESTEMNVLLRDQYTFGGSPFSPGLLHIEDGSVEHCYQCCPPRPRADETR